MDKKTEQVVISMPSETARRLKALNVARNGALNNTASALIERGIVAELALGPELLRERFDLALRCADLLATQ